MSRKLQDIRQAVAEYEAYAAKDEQEGYNYWLSRNSEEYAAKFANALTDLLAIAEAAKELSQSLNDNGATIGTYKQLSKLDDALAKLEGEEQNGLT